MQKKMRNLPLIPLRGLTAFPNTVLHFDVARKMSLNAVNMSVSANSGILLSTQRSTDLLVPTADQIFEIGAYARIVQVIAGEEKSLRVIVEVQKKVRLENIKIENECYTADFEVVKDARSKTLDAQAYRKICAEQLQKLLVISDKLEQENYIELIEEQDASVFANKVSDKLLSQDVKQDMLEETDVVKRLELLQKYLLKETEIARIERKISRKVKVSLDKNQKEYVLREHLRAIQEELGDDGGDEDNTVDKINRLPIDDESKQKLMKEYQRSKNSPVTSPDYATTRNYLDFVFDLPWNKFTEDNNDIKNAERILNEDHFGMEKIKERILEFLAVRQITDSKKEPILCLVGPPGVGKTSVVKSIAKALGRRYVRMSLGGVHDEAEIRGHRKTYVGAMAGRIISSIRQAGTQNPVFLLDEIDKLSSDQRGDPASAMLEVLDPEQNNAFRDNYLEIPFDLSKVIFVTTANDPYSISPALFDRMEVIEMSGYTPVEKLEIAKRHLIPKQLAANGLSDKYIKFDDEAVEKLINGYTRESGVRGLEKQIASVMRKVARKLVEENADFVEQLQKQRQKADENDEDDLPFAGRQADTIGNEKTGKIKKDISELVSLTKLGISLAENSGAESEPVETVRTQKLQGNADAAVNGGADGIDRAEVDAAAEIAIEPVCITAQNLEQYLGVVKYLPTKRLERDEVGTATGLAWTAAGGEILSIEVSVMSGKGEIVLTGHLGDVMKESARTAISYIRSHASEYGLTDDSFKDKDIHIHVPEGAIPKDGPSAGITLATALLSAFTNRGVKSDVAMTGEITLRGKVLAIGGLKEKSLAAHRTGIKTVLIPEDNKKDLEEIPEVVRRDLTFVTVGDVKEVFKKAID